jgi:5'-deoxynucleotidase YfbR-like HD superfamily hydrolase
MGNQSEKGKEMNTETREQIFLAMVEDFSEVIARHLPNFDNNIKDETWKLLELFTEEAIEQLAV